MALEIPLWLQNEEYPASADRALLDLICGVEGVADLAAGHGEVTERSEGANRTVDVAAFVALIRGTDETGQGTYLGRSTSTLNVPIAAAPQSGARIDLIVARVRDSTVAGQTEDALELQAVEGTPDPFGNPEPPEAPPTSIPLAEVRIQSGQVVITDAHITDRRAQYVASGGSGAPGQVVMHDPDYAPVPFGWAVCDGTGPTKDLRNRFIVGAGGQYEVGEVGGLATVTLTAAQMPQHNHNAQNLTAANGGAHSHTYNARTGALGADAGSDLSVPVNVTVTNTSNEPAHGHNVTGSTGNAGSGNAHENRPPFCGLLYIMRLKPEDVLA